MRFEAHRKHADVHVVLEGEERIDVAALTELTPVTAFDTEGDVDFHEGPEAVTVTLKPGWFLVCFPTDAHRPGQWVTEATRVRKAVGKLVVA